MTSDSSQPPSTRNWRDIPQLLKPRTMSRSGRWRLAWTGVRSTLAVAVGGVLLWGGWRVMGVLTEAPQARGAIGAAVPLRSIDLTTDGVLDHAWLERELALSPKATLMELDLAKLEERLESDNQVIEAVVSRHFPDRLAVRLTERQPIARINTGTPELPSEMLVARDGKTFVGAGYEADVRESLPWLENMELTPRGMPVLPIVGIEAVGELLSKARRPESEHLYREWRAVSLGRLADDRVLEVNTRSGWTVVFSASRGDIVSQLSRFDHLAHEVGRLAATTVRIDLSYGREVPVMLELAPPPAPERATPSTSRKVTGTPAVSFSPAVQAKTKREL